MSNTMSLKAKIRNIAKQKNIPAQVILQNYMFERLLVRLATSAYKDKLMGVNNIQPISPIMVNIRECVMRPCVLHKVKGNL